MNIAQIKQDQDAGVTVCRETYRKLVEAAMLMQKALAATCDGLASSYDARDFPADGTSFAECMLAEGLEALAKVEAL